jgi:hypothetical protein
MSTQAGILKGTPYIGLFGAANPLLPAGNTSKCSFSIETETKELPDFQNPGGGLDDNFDRLKSSKVALSFRHMKKHVLELVTGGVATTQAAGAVTAEAHNDIALGGLIVFAKAQNLALTCTVKKGATTYVEGTDYTRVRAGIIPLASGTMVAGDDITVDYTGLAAESIEGQIELTREYHVVFDGINERTGNAMLADWFRVKFGPAKNIEFIGDDYISFDVEGTLLKDESKTGTGISQYYKLRVVGVTN